MVKESFSADDYAELLKLANSPSGSKLVELMKHNTDSNLDELMNKMQAGDFTQAKEFIQRLLQQPEAQKLIKEMRKRQ